MYDVYLVVELTAECQRKEAEVKALKQELEETRIALDNKEATALELVKARNELILELDNEKMESRIARKVLARAKQDLGKLGRELAEVDAERDKAVSDLDLAKSDCDRLAENANRWYNLYVQGRADLDDMTKERDRAVATLDSWRQFAREAIKRLT